MLLCEETRIDKVNLHVQKNRNGKLKVTDHSAQSGIKVINVVFTKLIDIEMNLRYGTDYNFQIICMS